MTVAALALALALALSMAACGDAGGDASAGGGDGGVQAVASFYPLAEVARSVGGDRVRVVDLTPPGVEPHDLELSSRTVEQLEDADVVLYLGKGFQPGVETVAERADGTTVDALEGLPTEGDDPHVWLDPQLLSQIVDSVQAALTEADPAGGPGYAERADAYRRELTELDAVYRAGLAQCDRRVIVTAHDAFGYLTRRYGLQEEPIAGVSPEAEPDPARLAELADLVRRVGATTVFTESLVPPDVAETLAREAGVRTAVLEPVETLTDEQLADGENYFSVMKANLDALRAALGCN